MVAIRAQKILVVYFAPFKLSSNRETSVLAVYFFTSELFALFCSNLALNATLGVTDITNGPHKLSYLILPKDIIIHENYSDDGK